MPKIDIKGKARVISQNLINKFYKYPKYRINTIKKKRHSISFRTKKNY